MVRSLQIQHKFKILRNLEWPTVRFEEKSSSPTKVQKKLFQNLENRHEFPLQTDLTQF